MNLGVIMGGMSTEHYVSIVSGTSIVNNLNKKKYKIFPIYIDLKGNWYKYIKPIEEIEILQVGEIPQELEKINNEIEYLKNMDVVFPALHGLYGEDGTIQGLLELLNVKYVGCKVLASAVSMDKVYTKILFEKANIPQANYIYIKAFNNIYTVVDNQLNEQELNLDEVSSMVEKQLGYPAYVKPSNSGSSVGISKAKNSDELKTAIKEAVKYDKKILIEEEIKGKEIECAILKNEKVEASTVGEILSADEFYSFDAKYKNKDSKTVIPANISKMEIEEIRKLAIKAFNAVDGSGLARVDFFIKEADNKIYINEINTMPGFTQISMYPKLWEQCGIKYSDLLDKLIDSVYTTIFIDSTNPDYVEAEIKKILDNDSYTISNLDKEKREVQSLYTLVAIFLYGFITVIALIGITNIFNTITTSMFLRSKEFAMLKSVGMTNKEFNKMIFLESIMTCFKSLLIGIPIGIFLSYIMYLSMNIGINKVIYNLPITGILISILSVIVLILVIMKYSLNKINKQNIIETIRKDNI